MSCHVLYNVKCSYDDDDDDDDDSYDDSDDDDSYDDRDDDSTFSFILNVFFNLFESCLILPFHSEGLTRLFCPFSYNDNNNNNDDDDGKDDKDDNDASDAY